jgi:two-component sensor histidine kinase/PAS domain-containing protein
MDIIQSLPFLYLISVGITLFTAVRLLIWSRASLNISAATLLIALALAMIGYYFQLILSDVHLIVPWMKLYVFGVNLMYPAWLTFVLMMTGNGKRVTPGLSIVLGALSILPNLAMEIPALQPSFVIVNNVIRIGPFNVLEQQFGWVVWLSAGVAQIEGLLSAYYLARLYPRLRRPYQLRYFLFYLLPVLAFLAAWLEISGNNFIAPLSLFATSLIPISLIVSVAIGTMRIGQESQLLKEQVIDSMHSAVLLLDGERRLVYANPAAYRLQIVSANDHLVSVTELLPPLRAPFQSPTIPASKGDSIAVKSVVRINDFIFGVNISKIEDWKGDVLSQVLVLNNITDREQLERTILERNRIVEHNNTLLNGLAEVNLNLQKTTKFESIYGILDQVFSKMGLSCFILLLNDQDELCVHYFTNWAAAVIRIEKALGLPIAQFHLNRPDFPGLYEFFDVEEVHNNYLPTLEGQLPLHVYNGAMEKALNVVGIDTHSPMALFQLKAGEKKLGLLGVYGKSLLREDLPTLQVFTSQTAWAIERAERHQEEIQRTTRDYENELMRANKLARSNTIIIALSNVAARLNATSNPLEVIETLGRELQKIPLYCMVGTLDEAKQELKIEHLSIRNEVVHWAEKLGTLWPDDVRVPRRLWPTDKAVTEKKPYWDPNPISNAHKMFPFIPKSIFLKAYQMAGLNANDKVCYLPMISDEDVIGILAVWGPDLQEDDLAALSVFANQVATAIRSSFLYHQAQHEIKVRTQTEALIQETLSEKEVLLKEIHHRVKNNLQVISSMLNLQINQSSSPSSIEILRESQNRVRAMALIHEKLYQSNDLAHIDFKAYLQNLVSTLTQTYRTDFRKVQVQVVGNVMTLDIDRAIPCGLIVNELVSNSFKYAFSDGRTGQVRVECNVNSGGVYHLSVSDNGPGLPADFDHQTSPSLGLKLVNSLVEQIEGRMQVDSKHGARFDITFHDLN